ncbi:MAG: nitrous oxide reductase accessory protein NosL [Desulfomonilaceae bacterium]
MKKLFNKLNVLALTLIFVGTFGASWAFAEKAVELPDGSKIPLPATCAICGMKSQDEAGIHGALVFSSGKVIPFDTTSELFKYWLSPETFGFKASDVKKAFVIDHESGKFVDAQKEVYVMGSKVHAVMGPEMYAFSNKAAAEKFIGDSKDKKLLAFSEVSLKDVTTKKKMLKMKH